MFYTHIVYFKDFCSNSQGQTVKKRRKFEIFPFCYKLPFLFLFQHQMSRKTIYHDRLIISLD